MGTPGFPIGTGQKGFSGSICWTKDDGNTNAIVALPQARFSLNISDNPAYPDLVDSTQYSINKVLGLAIGTFSMNAVLRLDTISAGNISSFLNEVFGPRSASTGLYPSYALSILPRGLSGDTAIAVNGVYFDSLSLSLSFGTRGDSAMVNIGLTGYILNPYNITNSTYVITGASALTIPTNLGAIGSQIATFTRCSFSNGASTSPTIYDKIRSADIRVMNNLTVDPAILDPTNRIAVGCTPGKQHGMVSLTQLKGATSVVPLSGANNPVTAKIPAGDGTHTLTTDMSLSYDSQALPVSASDYNSIVAAYNLNGTSGTNGTGAATWPIAFSYGTS